MSLKKDAAVTLHIPEEYKEYLEGLADLHRSGMGAGEYIRELLVMPHIQDEIHTTKVKSEIFGLIGN